MGPSGSAASIIEASQRSEDLRVLAAVAAIALAIMGAASIGLGWLIAGRILRPLGTITATVRDFSARNLNRRLALGGPDDEFKELADTFDGLLGRLDASFESQRQFVAECFARAPHTARAAQDARPGRARRPARERRVSARDS